MFERKRSFLLFLRAFLSEAISVLGAAGDCFGQKRLAMTGRFWRVQSTAVAAFLFVCCAHVDQKTPDGLYAELITNKGVMSLFLEHEKTPMTVTNFVGLAEGAIANSALPEGVPYYHGTKFHRVVPGHVIQAGLPAGTDQRGPGYQFPNEIHPGLSHNKAGVLGMANIGPHTNTGQFYITLSDRSYLDGDYTVFGRVTAGMDVVYNIVQGDSIESIRILRIGAKAKEFKADTESFNRLVEMAQKRVAKEQAKKQRLEAEVISKNWPQAIPAENGLKFIVLKKGDGIKPRRGSKLTVVYRGKTLAGRAFTSSPDSGVPVSSGTEHAFEFIVGESSVTPGLEAALLEMQKGERTLWIIPSERAYGVSGFYGKEKKGSPRFVIPPNTTLVYEVELLDVIN
ncbi:MAG: peptidylprolyl isomerase [bacterium]